MNLFEILNSGENVEFLSIREEGIEIVDITGQDIKSHIEQEYAYIRVNKTIRIFASGVLGSFQSKADVQKVIDERCYAFNELEVIADDIYGGIFFLSHNPLLFESRVCYFSPNTLNLEYFSNGYEEFIAWCLSNVSKEHYSVYDWTGKDSYLENLKFDEVISFYLFCGQESAKSRQLIRA
jgi:hypothetical protein